MTQQEDNNKTKRIVISTKKWPKNLLNILIISIFVSLQLICDTKIILEISAFQALEPPISSSQTELQLDALPANLQQEALPSDAAGQILVNFLEEPQDTYAVLGQPLAQLRCVFTTQTNSSASLQQAPSRWFKRDLLLAFNQVPTLKRYQVEKENQYSGGTYGSGGEQDPEEQLNLENQMTTTTYTLKLANVSSADEDSYRCVGAGKKSRFGRLIIVRPPERLEVFVHSAKNDHHQQQATLEQQQQLATPSGSAGQWSAEQLQLAPIQALDSSAKLAVRLNSLVKLECKSDAAKPRAKLVWLDSEMRPLANDEEELNLEPEVDPTTTFGQISSTNYTFRVTAEHHRQIFHCQASHMAYSILNNSNNNNNRYRSIQLEVQYEPVIELVKDQAQVNEGLPVRLNCKAHARPEVLGFEWFIDDQQVVGLDGAELEIAKVSRQLHQRDIKCCVRNQLARSCLISRLNVTYSPQFVTHLLPSSLQPDDELDDYYDFHLPEGHSQQEEAQDEDDAAARQLVRVVRAGQNVTLRCDFDSNPKPIQIDWFKVNTGWLVMRDIEPREASELISGGLLRASFHHHQTTQQDWQSSTLASATRRGQHASKRNIARSGAAGLLQASQLSSQQPQLDFNQMSAELLEELERADELDSLQQERRSSSASSTNGSDLMPDGWRLVEQIVAEQHIQTQARIYEPLSFLWRPSLLNESTGQLYLGGSGRQALRLGPPASLRVSSSQQIEQERLLWRRAELASSSIQLHRVNEDSIGKYVCRARDALNRHQFARAIQLVLRQSPRIVSSREQFGQLGARQLQVECLVQLNGDSNQTHFRWFHTRPGEPTLAAKEIDLLRVKQAPNGGAQTERAYTLIEQRSPDLLFARSILRIHQAEFSDFGQYNCTVANSLGSDSMRIVLQPMATTGLVFNLTALLTFATIFALFGLLWTALFLAPWRQFQRAAKAAVSHKVDLDSTKPSRNASTTSGSDGEQSTGPVSLSADEEVEKTTRPASDRPSHSSSEVMLNGKTRLLNGESMNQSHLYTVPRRPGSALAGCYPTQRQQVGSLVSSSRCSLRFQQRPSNKFAAIHESLEHKLQFGQAMERVSEKTNDDPQKARLFGKLWDKFNGNASQTTQSNVSRLRVNGAAQRPTISLPTSFRSAQATGHSLAGSTSSGASSLTTLNNTCCQQAVSQAAASGQQYYEQNSMMVPLPNEGDYWPSVNQQQVAYSNYLDQSLYANYSTTIQQQQQQQQVAWVPVGSGQQQAAYDNNNELRQDQAESNYQMPQALMSEQYLASQMAAVQQGQQHQHQQQQQQQHYASKVATVMVPTSDGGDAFFESNYGTLLSKSSANKTLGYCAMNNHQQQHQHQLSSQAVRQLGSNGTSATSPSSSSSSSSPASSLTTHAPNNCPQATLMMLPVADNHILTGKNLSSEGVTIETGATVSNNCDPNQYTIYHYSNNTLTSKISPTDSGEATLAGTYLSAVDGTTMRLHDNANDNGGLAEDAYNNNGACQIALDNSGSQFIRLANTAQQQPDFATHV